MDIITPCSLHLGLMRLLVKPQSLLSSTFLFAHLALVSNAYASPEGGQVVGGSGSINQSGLNTTINQATQHMAIDWKSYNVQQNERVQYIQPNSSSISLNRIVGNNASSIHGKIDANGQVILVNPNGIFFSATSSINVGGLMASGLDIKPSDFMNGNFIFNEVLGTKGTVFNSGIINAATGGSVTLLGKQVKNDGMIIAKLGAVNMAAGKQAVVTFDNAGLLGVRITKEVLQNELGIDPAVLNSGTINAEGGRILLTASVSQDIFSRAVNAGDMVDSTSAIVNADGTFTLGAGADVVNAGTLDVSTNTENSNAGDIVVVGNNVTSSGVIKADSKDGNGGNIELHATDTTQLTKNSETSARAEVSGKGGNVKVLGNKVGLFDHARVDVSGANGGGVALIGGDRTGKNIAIRNAKFIYLGENTNVKADALDNGNGGKLITFASDAARIYGNLSVRGGANGGDGGFVETSGLHGFEITNTPDIFSPMGIGGEWLIDPYNINIVANGSAASPPNINNSSPFESAGGTATLPATLDVDLITNALGNGNVTITTGAGGTDAGDINFITSLNYRRNRNSTLTLNAANDINLNSFDIRADGGNNNRRLNLVFNANSDSNGGGDVVITDSRIYTNGGNFTATGVNFNLSTTNGLQIRTGNIYNNQGNNNNRNYASGNVSITTTGRALVVPETVDHPASISIGADIVTDGGAVTLISNQGAATTGGNVNVTTAGSIYTTDNIGNTNTPGTVAITADGTVNLAGSIITDNDSVSVARSDSITTTGTGSIDTTDGGNAGGSSGTISLNSSGVINIGSAIETRGAAVDFTSNSFVSNASGAINTTKNGGGSAGTVSIISNGTATTASSTTVGGAVQTQNGAVTLSANQGAFTSAGSIILNSTGSIDTQNGAVTASGATYTAPGSTITAGSGKIDLDGITGTVDLGNTTTTGNLSALNVGAVSQSNTADKVVVGGTTTISSTGSVNLNNATNNFNRIDVDATNLTLQDQGALSLGDLNLTGSGTTLNLTTGGNLRQAANTTISSNANTSINSGAGSITLDNTGNDFVGTVSLNNTAGSVVIRDANSINFATSKLGDGSLTVNAASITQTGGAITQAASAGLTSFNSGGAITLGDTSNDFTGAVSLNNTGANDVAITGSNTLNFGTSGLGTGAFTVIAIGISQTGGSSITQGATAGNVTLNGGAGAIALGSVTNEFTGEVALSNTGANNVALGDATSVLLGQTTVGGNLTVVANNGSITQAVTTQIINNAAGVVSDFSARGAGSAVTLANTGNDFTQINVAAATATLLDSNAIQLGNSTLTGAGTNLKVTAAGNITQQAGSTILSTGSNAVTDLTATGNAITLNGNNNFTQVNASSASLALRDSSALVLGAINLSGSGGTTLDVNTGGALTQAVGASITNNAVGAVSKFTSTNNITLENAGNDFTQVDATASSLTILDANALTLGAMSLTGGGTTLNVTTAGLLNQTANPSALVSNGNTIIDTGANAIMLDNTNNDFGGTVSLNNTAGNIRIADANSIDFATSNIGTGSFTVNAGRVSGGGIAQTGGAITQAVGAGAVTLDAGNGAIALGDTSNDFKGNITLNTSGTNNTATIVDANSIQLAEANITGDLNVTAGGIGDITQLETGSGLTVGGTSTFDVAVGHSIKLGNTSNKLRGLSFLANGSSVGQLRDVTVANSTGLDLQSLNLSGDLTVTAIGDISNSFGSMQVAGDTVLTANLIPNGTNNITLTGANNEFNNIVIKNGGNVIINEANVAGNGLNIGDGIGTASQITGDLSVTTAGDITQTAALTMNANTTASFGAGNAGDITLNNGLNDFSNIVITSGNNVSITDINGINIGDASNTQSNIAGTLTIAANGNITQSAALANNSTARFTAGSGDITLNDASNDFNMLELSTIGSASITDTNTIQLGNITVSRALTINAGGDISEAASSSVSSSGLTTLTSAGAIQLGSGNHDFNNLSFTGSNVAINDISGINIGSGNPSTAIKSSATSGLTITTNGKISDVGSLSDAISSGVTVTGAANLNAGTGDIALANTDFQGSLSASAGNSIVINDATDLNIASATSTSLVDFTSGGVINSSGVIASSRVNLQAENGINVSTQTSTLKSDNTAGNVTVNNTGNLILESLTTSGDIVLNNDLNISMTPGSVNANYDVGNLEMTSTNGSFLGLGAPNINNADVTAFTATFVGRNGSFGSVVRPIVLNVKESVLINTRRSISPRITAPGPRLGVTDLSDLQFNFSDASNAIAGEQLISLEELEDIDPAIFSDVRNYTYGQVAILLPRDQLFEDELKAVGDK